MRAAWGRSECRAGISAYGTTDSEAMLRLDSAANALAEENVFIPKGIVITTLATEAWLAVFVMAVAAKAALSWLL